MKKIILSIIAVLAVLWVALFVSNRQVLIWETSYSKEDCEDEGSRKWDGSYKNKKVSIEAPKHFELIDLNEFNAAVQKKIDAKDYKNYPAFPETIILTCEDVFTSLDCRYFNGRKIIRKRLNKTLNDSCPNFRENK